MDRRATIIQKISLGILLVLLMSSCFKDSVDPYAMYTKEREDALMEAWLDSMVARGVDLDTTATGIYYSLQEEGVGPLVKDGDTLIVYYEGSFLDDGTTFSADTLDSVGDYPYIHLNNHSRLIDGWEEGIEDLNQGAKAVFMFPSSKAYGPYGYGIIPPYSPLLFYLEVISINGDTIQN